MLAINTLFDRLSGPVTASVPKSAIADDMARIRAASELTRDLVQPSARIDWTDFLASPFVGYEGIAAAIFAPSTAWMLVAAVVAVVPPYRAGSLLHELTHLRKNAQPGFRLARHIPGRSPLLHLSLHDEYIGRA